MIQKEVAERIAAGPGSKTYGILSVLIQAWYKEMCIRDRARGLPVLIADISVTDYTVITPVIFRILKFTVILWS